MQHYSQSTGAQAFNPNQFAPYGQFAGSQPNSPFGAPGGSFLPFTDPSTAFAQPQTQLPPQFAQPFGAQPFAQQPQTQIPPQFLQPFAQQPQTQIPPQFLQPFGAQPFAQQPQTQIQPQFAQQPHIPPQFLQPFGAQPFAQQPQTQIPPQFLQPFGAQPFAQQPQAQVPPQFAQPFAQPQLARQPFLPDPTLAAYALQLQQAQLAQQFAPQGFFGGPLGQLPQPVGQQFGATQLQRQPQLSLLNDPYAAIYVQQLAQQLLQAQLAQQLTPPGIFGSQLPQSAQPFGATIGSIFSNPALAAANQQGRYQPFLGAPLPYAAPLMH